MSNRLKTGRRLLLCCSSLFPVLLTAAPAFAQAVNLGGAGNLIVPDGRTQTSVTNSGNVTDVRTDTVRGDVGFNSFSRFEAGAGNTVNLHLAPNTGTLVNVVRDAPVVVEGTVNALKNGTIGGNVVFSDPYGFVLGKEGTINTGGLTVNTPTREFLEGAIGRDGRIDTGMTDRLISGDVPISPDGSVVIRGRVNAQTHVDINAASIDIDPEAKLRRHRENFEASVNTEGGASQGAALVVRDGRIQLVATGNVRVGGSLAARATSRESAAKGAGRVTIRAGGNVTITPTARIEALAAIAREKGPEAVTAIVGIEAGEDLDVAGEVRAIGEGGAGASVNLAADRIAIKAGALIAAQIAAEARSASVNMAATRDIAFDGRVEAKGAARTKGGEVALRAGSDIVQGAASSIDASGEEGSAGGDIAVVARRDLTVADGAGVSARGSGEADGGFVELSGHRDVLLGAVALDLSGSGSGKGGHLYIDPLNLTVSAGSNYHAGQGGLFETVDSAEIDVIDKITVAGGGRVDAGTKSLVLTARQIEIAQGGEVRGRDVTISTRTIDPTGQVLPAEILIAGTLSGGDITLDAIDQIRIAGTGIVRSETIAGTGASIALSSRKVVVDAGASVSATGDVTMTATRAGSLLDQITDKTAFVEVSGAVSGRTVTASALDRIAVRSGGSVTGQRDVAIPGQTPATRFAISLASETITLDAGSTLASNSGTANLFAEALATGGIGETEAKASISIGGIVTGRDLVATATTLVMAQKNGAGEIDLDEPETLVETIASNRKLTRLIGTQTGLRAGYYGVLSEASVKVLASADIDMTGDVKLAAEGTQFVSNFVRRPKRQAQDTATGVPLGLSVYVGSIRSTTEATIEAGASVDAGGLLSVAARNDATMSMKTTLVGKKSTMADAAVAVGLTDIETSAIIHSGARISAGRLSIAAENLNTLSVVSKTTAAGEATAGLSLAIQLSDTAATARLGADYGSTARPGGDVSIAAYNNTILNRTKADVTVGGSTQEKDSGTKGSSQNSGGGGKAAGSAFFKSVGFLSADGSIPTLPAKGGLALGLNLSTHAADASIAAGAGATAPRLVTAGNVVVASAVYDAPIRSNASADVKESKDAGGGGGTGQGTGQTGGTSGTQTPPAGGTGGTQTPGAGGGQTGGADIGGALAFSIAAVNHVSHATIGEGVRIEAANLGVSATSDTPIFVGLNALGLDELSSPKQIRRVVESIRKVEGAVVDMIGTSFAGTSTNMSKLGIGAAVNYLELSHDTRAWIASDAFVRTSGTSAWSTTLDVGVRARPLTPFERAELATELLGDLVTDGTLGTLPAVIDADVRGANKTLSFRSGVDLTARSETQTINIAGSPAWLITSPGTGSDKSESSVGGSANINVFRTSTVAGIGAGADIGSATGINVDAKTRDIVFAIAPTSGEGAGIGINGLVSVVAIDNKTTATISNAALVSAVTVGVNARQQTDLLSVAGALSRSGGTSVGLAGAWTNVATQTSAFVGNNDSVVSGTPVANRANTARGSISTDALTVSAQSDGSILSLSVAAAVAQPQPPKAPPAGGNSMPAAGSGGAATQNGQWTAATASGNRGNIQIGSQRAGAALTNNAKLPGAGADPQAAATKVQNSIAVSGSVSGVTTGIDTLAYLDGATVLRFGAAGSVAVTVDAVNDMLISTTSGAASLSLAGQGGGGGMSAAVAGAVAIALSDNKTGAFIRNGSIVTDAGATRVSALAAGQQTVLGLGLAANTNAGSAFSIAGSISLGMIFDNVNAGILDSTITASSASDLTVQAYQKSDIGIGGLAIAVSTQGSAGIGLAITGTVIGDALDPTDTTSKAASATIENSVVTGYRNVTLDAATLSRVLAGAGSVGVAPNGIGLTGAIAFNDISSTTFAGITGTAGLHRVSAVNSVVVRSGSKRTSEADTALARLDANRHVAKGFDFSQDVLGESTTGSLIFSGAMAGAGGKNAGGVAILYNGVRQGHESLIEGASVSAATGDISVESSDDTRIIGVAAGISVATGEFGGAGSIVVNLVKNKTSATVRNATLSARDIAVLAENTSLAGGGAGSIGIGASAQGTGLGLSLISGAIANDTDAVVSGGTLTASRDVAIGARSAGQIVTAAVSVGAGGTVGIAGSIANSVAANDARALVSNAVIEANNNVLVHASNADSIHTVAGAVGVSLKAAGVGLSTVVNVVRGETIAAVDGGSVVARGAGDAATVDNGKVATAYAFNLENFAKSVVLIPANLTNGTRLVSGLSVGAVSQQKVSSASLAVGVAINADTIVSVAGAVSPVVNVLGGKTEARIDGASINTAGADNRDADVAVTASSNTFAQNAVVAAAGATGVAGAGAFVSNIMERETTAVVRNAAIGAAGSVGAVDVVSNAVMDSSNLVAGLSVGLGAVSGSMIVNVFDADTTAQLSGGSLTARALSVKADTDTGYLGVAGSGAGGALALAGAMNVSVNLGSTKALVGAGNVSTSLLLSEDLKVSARAFDEQYASVVGGAVSAGGGSVAVAGMLNFSVLLSDTIASVDGVSGSMRSVDVDATHSVLLMPITGGTGISVDGVGVGAAANVMLTKSTVAAEIVNSSFATTGSVKVAALGQRQIEMVTATLGGGAGAGLGASVGIVVAGIRMSADAENELGSTLSGANRQSNQDVGSSQGADYVAQGGGTIEPGSGNANASGLRRQNVVTNAVDSTKQDKVIARIEGGSITGGVTTVNADSRIKISNFALGAGIGGSVAGGAALGFTFVNQHVQAGVSGTHSFGSLSVAALSSGINGATSRNLSAIQNRKVEDGTTSGGRSIVTDGDINVTSIAGAGSLVGALGAAVAVSSLDSTVKASVGGSVTTNGRLAVNTGDTTSVRSNAIGVAVGVLGGGIGVSIAVAERGTNLTSEISDSSTITNASGVEVGALSTGRAETLAVAGGAGLIGAGAGATATSLDDTNVTARIGAGATLSSIKAGGVAVAASATPTVKAETFGVAIATGGAVGASISVAEASNTVTASIGRGATIQSLGKLSVTADLSSPAGTGIYARSVAGSGALYLAAQASVSRALSTGRAGASILDGVTIDTRTLAGGAETGRGDIEVAARSATRQQADTTGVAVSLGLSLGATVAEAKSDVETRASVGANSDIRARNLSIFATGDDRNVASAIAGGGGLVSGSAAVVVTANRSVVEATLGSGSASDKVSLTGTLSLNASHLAGIGGSVSSVNAGVVGASGARAQHSVSSTVIAAIAANAEVAAADLAVSAMNRTHRLFAGEAANQINFQTGRSSFNGDTAGWNLDSGSGGILNLPAGESRTTISHTTHATLGDNARVTLDKPSGRSLAAVTAANEIVVHDKVRLDSGGLIATADTRTYLDVTKNEAKVGLGAGARLVLPNGNAALSAYDNAHLDLRAASTTYGLAGAPTGHAQIDYRRTNLVDLGESALVEANSRNDILSGNIAIAAGASLDANLASTLSRVSARATVDLFNKTVIAIPTVPNPLVDISGNSTIRIADSVITDTGVRAAGDITLTATRGLVDASAVGTGKDIYRESLATVVNGVASLFGADNITFDYKGGSARVAGLGLAPIDGDVVTGIARRKSLTIDYATNDANARPINGAACLTSISICLALTPEGSIGFAETTGLPLGTTIVDRLKELRELLSQYGSDPVASAAYRGEISFLEKKLVALGLSRDGSSGSYSVPTVFDEKTAELELARQALNGIGGGFDTSTRTVVTNSGNAATAGTTIGTSASTVETSVANGKAAADSILAGASTLSGYDTDATRAANAADAAEINRLTGVNAGLASDIGSARQSLASARQAIADARTEIEAQQKIISDTQKAIGDLPFGSAASAVSALEAKIETARSAIVTSTATIEARLADADTHAATIETKSASVASNLQSIQSRQESIVGRSNKGTTGDTTIVAAIGGQQTNLETARSNAATSSATIATNAGSIGTAQTNSSSAFSSVQGYATSRTTLASTVQTLETGFANNAYSKVNPSAPTTSAVTVEDTVVRLGDINVFADQVTGNGLLSAPGDAAISIVNNTAHTLNVGNLTVDSESGGTVRYNGVTVNGAADIQRINVDKTAPVGLTVVSSTTQGVSVPAITIQSNYNVDSATYYDANATQLWRRTANPAPDIVVLKDKALSNVRGAVRILSEAGNVYVRGSDDPNFVSIAAGSVDITAKNGDYVQGFTYGFEHVGGDPAYGKQTGMGILANGAVNISARYLNINSTIQSGIADWGVTIPAAPKLTASASTLGVSGTVITSLLDAYKRAVEQDPATAVAISELETGLWFDAAGNGGAGRLSFTIDYAKGKGLSGKFTLDDTVLNIPATIGRPGKIEVSYDTALDRYIVDGTNVRGGFIQIFGQIMNTSGTSGALNVLDGYGQIAINNLGSRDVVIGKLDAGEDPTGTGRGVAGRIELTDIYSVSTGNAAKPVTAVRTVFTRDNGKVSSKREVGYLTATGIFEVDAGGTTTTVHDARMAGYDPQTGLRYNWTTGVDNSTKVRTHYKGTEFFGNSDWRTDPDLEVVSRDTTQLSSYRLKDGTYVSLNTATGEVPKTYSNGATTSELVDDWRDCNWWTLCIAADYNFIIEDVIPTKTITTHTLKADNRIAVNFIGYDTGSVTVASGGSVVLNGAVNNKTGSTTISSSAGSIVREGTSQRISSKDISLSAAGSVGGLGLGEAIAVDMTGGLSGSAGNGNFVVDASSAVAIGTITASGDARDLKGRVVLSASGSITGNLNSKIEAPRVELTSRYGSIGSTSNLLTVNTGYANGSGDRPFGDPAKGENVNAYYGLKVTAAGDIGLRSTSWSGNADGSMLVDRVVSGGGNVSLSTPGAILDNNPIQSIDTRTWNELVSYWNSLGLQSGAANSAKVQAVIDAFQNQITSEKLIFDQLQARTGSGVYDRNFAFAMNAAERQAFVATLGLPATATTAEIDAAVTAYEALQTARYHDFEAKRATLTGTFGADGKYTASNGEIAARSQGAIWTDRELAFSLSAGALKTITGTNPVLKAPNVSGRTVTLSADKGLGEVASTVVIPIDVRPQDLTDAQKVALATAERSDFLPYTQGGPLRISSVRMLNVDALDRLNVAVSSAGTNASIASLGDIRFGTVSVTGELRAKARGSLVNALGADALSAGSYVLEASNGGIGWSRALDGTLVAGQLRLKPVNTTGTPGQYRGAIVARAAELVDLSVEGDANIDTVYSRKDVSIDADGDIRNASGDQLINILAETVTLKADGSIGSSTNRLNIGNGLNGAVSADAGGSIHLYGPDGYKLTLDSVIARGGVLDVMAGQFAPSELLVRGRLDAGANANLTATGRIAFGAGGLLRSGAGAVLTGGSLRMIEGSSVTAGGQITVATQGNAQVTALTSAQSAPDAIRVTAGGRILAGTGQNRVDLKASAPGGGVVLQAGLGIGDRGVSNTTLADETAANGPNPLRIDAASLDAASGGAIAVRMLRDVTSSSIRAAGDIDLLADAGLQSALLRSAQGSVRILAKDAATIARIEAAGAVSFTGGATARIDTALSGGSQQLIAENDLAFGSLQATVGDIAATSRTGAIDGTSVKAGGSVSATAKRSVTADMIDAAANVTLTAGQSIAVRQTTAGAGVSADAGTTLTAGRIASGASQRLVAVDDLTFGSLDARAGDIAATSQAGSVKGRAVTSGGRFAATAKRSVLVDTIGTGTNVLLGAGDAIDVRQIDAGTSVGADAGTVLTLGRVISGASQLLGAVGDIAFGALDAKSGVIAATSRTGSVQGSWAVSGGLFAAKAKRSIVLDRIGTGTSVSLGAGEAITVRETDAGTNVAADAGTRLTLGRVTSGASQELVAVNDLAFGTLEAKAGDIAAASRAGSVEGRSVTAGGFFAASAKRAIAADAIGTGTSVSLGAGEGIAVGNTVAGTSLTADAGSTLSASRIVSGGSQSLTANGDLVFGFLKSIGISADAGDIALLSRNGGVFGGSTGTIDAARDLSVEARLGLTFEKLTAGRDMRIRTGGDLKGQDLAVGRTLDLWVGGTNGVKLRKVTGRDLTLSVAGPFTVETVATADRVGFHTPELQIGTLQYTGNTVLGLDITGFEGAIARYAALTVDAPAIAMKQLFVTDSRFRTNAFSVTLADGRVPGSMEWLTPWRTVWMNNRFQQPTLSHNVQLYKPSGSFAFDQLGNRTATTSYVVRYGLGSNIHQLFNGEAYLGASFIRNFEAAMQDPSNDLPGLEGRERSLLAPNFTAMMNRFLRTGMGSVTKALEAPAVNLGAGPEEGENEAVLEEAALR
ncbi:leukotoxin LktA family filamentous adhesin [Fulvimarina endophytica]|uniref:Leukotoxin LktA family filamentous adhesin n=1 Tax=Fulvimarina endophytica TaxID=2293836 RepID=A0A371XAB9_9HYPH|nr:leukotoxin LktA family filamentous adhesin [Fulvimarina endophytica]RFC65994.1 leukotoxin LktA family filamentous adhesin [Fulvimarina endophytica]